MGVGAEEPEVALLLPEVTELVEPVWLLEEEEEEVKPPGEAVGPRQILRKVRTGGMLISTLPVLIELVLAVEAPAGMRPMPQIRSLPEGVVPLALLMETVPPR